MWKMKRKIPFFDFWNTIMQVTIARVYNWDVHQRRLRQAAGAATDS